jgi:ankyrin repeat protein
LVKSLIESGQITANTLLLNDFGHRVLPLHEAISADWLKGVELLLSLKADVNARAPGGITALHQAVGSYRDQQKVIDLLLSLKADINAQDSQVCFFCFFPLFRLFFCVVALS